MSKRKHKKEIYQPDDKLFKVVMENKKGAAQYLKTHYRELAELLDLETLEIQRENFSIPNLKVFDADISYKCQFKKSEEKINISFLWENKSQPEKYVAIQIGLYLFLRYYKMVKKKNQSLEPIIPLIFYNGKEDWMPQKLIELFEDHSFKNIFKSFIPTYDFHFTNIKKVPKEELLKIEMAFFKSAMIAMANKHNYDLLFQNFSVIFDLDDEDELITIGHYVFGIYERLPEKVKKEITQLDYKIQNKIMSTLAILRNEGKVEGKIEGKVEAKIELAKKLKKEGFSISKIAELLEVEENFVSDALKSSTN